MSTLWNLLIREKHIDSLSIRLGIVKCIFRKNHSSHSNHAPNLISLGTVREYTNRSIIIRKFDWFIYDGFDKVFIL